MKQTLKFLYHKDRFSFQTKLTEARASLSASEVKASEAKCEADVLIKEMDQIRTENEKLSCQLADMSGKYKNCLKIT